MESLLYVAIALSLCMSVSGESKYNAIFNFGDSFSDTGNGIVVYSGIANPSARLPYGQTFGRPTGRWSDGRLIVDFIAEAFEQPYLLPYLAHNHSGAGVNFAVGGATALDADFFLPTKIVTNSSLKVQLGWFKDLKPSLCATQQDCDAYLKKSLFLVGEIGGNDITVGGFLAGRTMQQVEAFVPLIVDTIINTTIALIEEGAVELVVANIFPPGCSAVILTKFRSPNISDYDSLGCLTAYNALVERHNSQLKASVETLRNKYPLAKIIYADYYGATMEVLRHPELHGLNKDSLLMTCCGWGGPPYNFNKFIFCGMPFSKPCEDPSSYAIWDGLHLTEAAYHAIADAILNGPFTDPPLIERAPIDFM